MASITSKAAVAWGIASGLVHVSSEASVEKPDMGKNTVGNFKTALFMAADAPVSFHPPADLTPPQKMLITNIPRCIGTDSLGQHYHVWHKNDRRPARFLGCLVRRHKSLWQHDRSPKLFARRRDAAMDMLRIDRNK